MRCEKTCTIVEKWREHVERVVWKRKTGGDRGYSRDGAKEQARFHH
jgi:hypothetical protein